MFGVPKLPLFFSVGHAAHQQMAWMLRSRVKAVLFEGLFTQDCVCVILFPCLFWGFFVFLFLYLFLREYGELEYIFSLISHHESQRFKCKLLQREERGTRWHFPPSSNVSIRKLLHSVSCVIKRRNNGTYFLSLLHCHNPIHLFSLGGRRLFCRLDDHTNINS